jgi:hypothetical protein
MASERVASVADHNRRAGPERASRSAYIRSAATNNPLACPPGVNPRSSEGRRWRDLAVHYAGMLGPERMTRENVRTRLRAVLWLSVELDRLQGERLCDRPVPLHTVLHLTQELRTLLAELGLNDETRSSSQQPVLRDYLYSKNGAAP